MTNPLLTLTSLIAVITSATAAPIETREDLIKALVAAQKAGKIISGQHTRAADKAARPHITDSVREVYDKTDPPVWVGIRSCDIGIYLEGVHDHSPPWFKSTDDLIDQLAAWSRAGGMIELVNHQPNPEGGDSKSDFSGFQAVLDPEHKPKVYQRFWKRLDQTAAFFKRLEENKVPALWRPMHEMNADWFWWGDRGADNWSKDFATLWRQIHARFTEKHGLKNLVWVYSPDGQTRPERALAGWPGDEYVDAVGIDFYNSFSDPEKRKTALVGWELLKAKGKPMGITEVGPFTFGSPEQNQDGRYDYVRDMLEPVLEHFPEASFFVPWYEPWAPTRNPNFNALYHHPAVLNRGESAE